MTRRRAYLLLVLWMLAIQVAMVAQAPPALRILLVAPILYMPGRLALGCFDIRQSPLDRSLSSLLLSIAILMMCGLTLHLVQALTPTGWLIATGVVTALLLAHGGAAGIVPPRTVPSFQPALVGQVVLALALGVVALRATLRDARDDRPFEVLEMWLTPDATGRLQLGIHNGERVDKTLALEIRGEGRIVEDRRTLILSGHSTLLRPVDIVAVPEKPEAITAVLYAKDNTIARRVKVVIGARRSAELNTP